MGYYEAAPARADQLGEEAGLTPYVPVVTEEDALLAEHEMALKRLTVKQRTFVDEYLVSLDPGRAAIAAGYSSAQAKNTGNRLLGKPFIARVVGTAMELRNRRTGITQDMIVTELAKMAFSNVGDYYTVGGNGAAYMNLEGATRSQLAPVKKIKTREVKEGRGDSARDIEIVEFELYDKMAALKLLGQHIGMFSDKLEITGSGGGPIQIEKIEVIGIERGTYVTAADSFIEAGDIIEMPVAQGEGDNMSLPPIE